MSICSRDTQLCLRVEILRIGTLCKCAWLPVPALLDGVYGVLRCARPLYNLAKLLRFHALLYGLLPASPPKYVLCCVT